MKIGNYDVFPLETGRFALDGGAMFGVIPKNLWEKSNPSDEKNRISLALRSLLLRSTEQIILIDTGIGTKLDKKFSNIYNVDTVSHNLASSLLKHHLRPEDITDVILTHLHFDHAGGTTYFNEGQLNLTFPNASHHVQGEHWDWALQPSEKDRASFIEENFLLLENTPILNKLSGPCELFPGLEIFVVNGHTPAMQMVKIADSYRTLLYCADLFPTASHIPVPWIMAYDTNPLRTINEKNMILPKVVNENWMLFFEHDPLRSAATVTLTEKGYKMDQEISFLE